MKPRLIPVFLVLLVVAFAVGRYSARQPDEHLEVAEKEQLAASEEVEQLASFDVEEAASEERQEERVRIVYRDRWRTPDGAEGETEIEVDAEALRQLSEVSRAETAVETRVEIREVEVVREVEVERIVRTPLPDWRVSGMVGLEIDRVAPVYGLQVERRILGPIHVGAWGLSTGAAGLAISVIF